MRNVSRKQRRQPVRLTDDGVLDPPNESQTTEERVSAGNFLDHVFSFLPEGERRAVILHGLEGYTLKEVAEKEGISADTAGDRYRRGMAKLRQVEEEERRAGVVPNSAALAAFLGPDDGEAGLSRELIERAWSQVAAHLGLDDPPESGARARTVHHGDDTDRPPSNPRPSRRTVGPRNLRMPVVAILLCGLSVSGHREHAVPGFAAMLAAASGMDTAPPIEPPIEPAATAAAPRRPAPQLAAPTRDAKRTAPQPTDDDDLTLMARGRFALVSRDPLAALRAFDEHARQFPDVPRAAERERLWTGTCARYRAAHPQGDVPEIEKLCTSR